MGGVQACALGRPHSSVRAGQGYAMHASGSALAVLAWPLTALQYIRQACLINQALTSLPCWQKYSLDVLASAMYENCEFQNSVQTVNDLGAECRMHGAGPQAGPCHDCACAL